MSEEIQNAALVVPRSIMTGIMINGSLGFGMVLTVLYRAGDIDAALAENPAYPFMAIFKHGTNSTAAAAVMSALVFCLALSATVGLLASSSRVFWAFSRDKGLPGWRKLSQVSELNISVSNTTLTRDRSAKGQLSRCIRWPRQPLSHASWRWSTLVRQQPSTVSYPSP